MEVSMETANRDHNTRPLKQLCSQLVHLSSQLNDLQSSSLDLRNLWDPLNHLSIQLHQLSHQLNQLQLSDNKASNQWRDLPTVILEAVYKRLDTRTDFNRMSAVCKPWRTSLSHINPKCPTKFNAHLGCVKGDCLESEWFQQFGKLSTEFWLTPYIVHLVSHRHNGSINIMWLAKISNSSTMLLDLDQDGADEHIESLFRPHRENDQVLNILNYRMVEVCRSYHLLTESTDDYRWKVPLLVKIAVLSDTATSDVDFVLLALSNKGAVAGWNTMTRGWCEIKGYMNKQTFVDVVSYQNNLYAINTNGQLHKVSHLNWSMGKPTRAPSGDFIRMDDKHWNYNSLYCTPIHVLLESDDHLYLLNKSEQRYDQGNHILNVYVLDEKAWEWKAVKDLRNRVFFVLISHCYYEPHAAFSLSAEDLRQDTGNCIYWFDQCEHDCDDWGKQDIWTRWEYSISSSCFKVKHSCTTAVSKPVVMKTLRAR